MPKPTEISCCLAHHTEKVYYHAMELRHLRYFVAVAEEQNITRAAARLHVSQPPLSRQIRDLETELGVSLLHRGSRSVRLTDAGKVFLDEARAVLNRADEAIRTVRAIADGERGDLHVGYAPSLTVELLPLALREFDRLRPGVRVTLHDLSTEEMLRGLRDQSLHVALTIRPPTSVMSGLVFRELRRYQVRLAVPTGHPLAHGAKPRLSQVWKERLLAYTKSDYPEYYEWLEDLAGASIKPYVAEEHDSSSSLVAAIEAGRGIALVPESFSCFVGSRLTLRPLASKLDPFPVGVTSLKSNLAPPAATFIQAAMIASSTPKLISPNVMDDLDQRLTKAKDRTGATKPADKVTENFYAGS